MNILRRPSWPLRYRSLTLTPWFRHPVRRVKVAMALLLPGWITLMGGAWLTIPHVVPEPHPTSHTRLWSVSEHPHPGSVKMTQPMPASSVMRWTVSPAIKQSDAQATEATTAEVPRASHPVPLREPPSHWQLTVYRPTVNEVEIQAGLRRAQDRLTREQWVQAREELQAVLRLDSDRVEALEWLWQLARHGQDGVAEHAYADRLQQLLPDYFSGDVLPAVMPQGGQD